MHIEIDDEHFATTCGFHWTLCRNSGKTTAQAVADCGSLRDLSASLASRGLIPKDSPRIGRNLDRPAEGIEARLLASGSTSFAFGAGRFSVRKGQGDWHLQNPSEDVARLRDRENGRRNFVAFVPSIRPALLLAVERVMQADLRRTSYDQLDAVAEAAATWLWADVVTVTPQTLPALLPTELGTVAHA